MNNLSTLWQGIVDELNDNKDDLGIGMPGDPIDPDDPDSPVGPGLPGAERAHTGQVITLSPPSVAVWIQPQPTTDVSQNGALWIPVDVHVFCAGAPTADEASSVDNALEIAINIINYLTNKDFSGITLEQPTNESAIDIVESSSTQSIVGVLLKAKVTL